ncbi:MAG: hypothetical protein RXR20_14440, partial [Paraburkholderia sp.]
IELLSLCLHGGPPAPLLQIHNKALSGQAERLQALVPQGFAGQASRSGVQDFWEVGRDSTAKITRKGSYPQGRIIPRLCASPVEYVAKLLTTKRKPV